ncbi:MAG: toxic anion resistance protein [bacterium]
MKEQSIAIAEQTTSQTLDIAVIKQAWDDAKSTLLEVQKVYKTALPKMEAQVRALEQINAEAADFIKKIESKEGTSQTSLQIIEDLGQ